MPSNWRPGRSRLASLLATSIGLLGRLEKQRTTFRGALSVDPDNGPANRAMAAFSVATGRYRDAEQYLVRVADTSKDPNAVFALSEYYIASGRAKDAIARLESIPQEQRDGLDVGQRLARAYAASGDGTKAKALVEQVLSNNPKAVDGQLLKGQLLVREGRRDEAFTTVQAAVASNPSSAEAQFALGRMYASRGDTAGAEAAFTEVLRLNPRAGAARVELARLQLSTGQAAASVRTGRRGCKEPTWKSHRAHHACARTAGQQGPDSRRTGDLGAAEGQPQRGGRTAHSPALSPCYEMTAVGRSWRSIGR